MSPFRTSVDCAGFREPPKPAAPDAQVSAPDASGAAEPSDVRPRWWQRLGRKGGAAAGIPRPLSAPEHDA